MNRRDFIGGLILASAGVPGSGFGSAQATGAAGGLNYRHQPKVKADLPCPEEERKLVSMLLNQSRHCSQFGGPVVSRLSGSMPPWANLLVDIPNFSKLKTELFRFGVTPVSTPQFPSSFIKFHYGDQVYNLMNCGVEEFCQINRLKSRANLVPFAHNFVLYDLRRKELYDPYGALAAPRPKGQPEMVLLSRPRNLPDAFDCLLTARFDAKFLGLSLSDQVLDFEKYVLNEECPEVDLPRIVERVVNYLPDVIESLDATQSAAMALSPLVTSSMKRALGVDISKVWSRVSRSSEEDSGALFVALVKEGMGTARSAAGFEDELCLYLAKNGFAMRRTDLVMESLRVMG